MGASLKFVSAPRDNPVLHITMSLYPLFTKIFSQDEDPADSVPTDQVDDSYLQCMIL